jgi:hypothetical protein
MTQQNDLQNALTILGSAIENASKTVDVKEMKKLAGTGITDLATKKTLLIKDDGIYSDHAHIKLLHGDVGVLGGLRVAGNLTAPQIDEINNKLNDLKVEIDEVSCRPMVAPEMLDRSISGNKISGGRIVKFQSTGIVDESTDYVLNVSDKGITVKHVYAKSWVGDAEFTANVHIAGELRADSLHINKLTSDNRLERSSSLDFVSDANSSIIGKGLRWRENDEPSKQFIFRNNDSRLWSSEDIDLQKDRVFRINNREVLSESALGSGIVKSNLTQVGALQGLTVHGNMNIDEFMFWNSDSGRLGIGTEEPNAMLSLASYEAEFIIDVEQEDVRIGTWTTDDLHIITDDTARITISKSGIITLGTKDRPTKTVAYGNLNVNVTNSSNDVDIETAGPVRFTGKKFEVGSAAPKAGAYALGDIVWNDTPKSTSYVGWICTRPGTPGIWKPFGQIGS